MALAFRKGVFTANTGTGNQAVNVTTGGTWPASTTPLAVILWAEYSTTAPDNIDGDQIFSMGVGTFDGGAVQHAYVSYFGDDGVGTMDLASGINTTAILKGFSAPTTPTVDYEADFVSFGSDQFTINWANAPASAIKVHYIVLGGGDITAACVHSFTPTATATQDVTVNTGFGKPDLVMFLTTQRTSLGDGAGNAGFAVAAGDRAGGYASYYREQEATACTATLLQRPKALIHQTGNNVIEDEADIEPDDTQWPTDGYQLNWTDQPATLYPTIGLALKGTFEATIGHGTSPQTAGSLTQTLTASGTGTPKGVLMFGGNIPLISTIEAGHADLGAYCVGGSDFTNEGCCGHTCDDGNTTAIYSRWHNETNAFQMRTFGATSVLKQAADAAASGSDVELTWDATDSIAREYGYVFLSESAAGTTVSPASLEHSRAQGDPDVNPQALPASLAHTRAQGAPTVATVTAVTTASLTHTRAQGSPQANVTVTFPASGPSGLGAPLPLLVFQGAGVTGLEHARVQGSPIVSILAGPAPASLERTRAQGAPTVSPTVTPTGQAHTRAQGTPALSPTVQPAGQAHTRTQGTPTASPTLTPAGQAHTRAQGSPQANPTVVPASLAHTRAQGDPTVTAGFVAAPTSLTHARAQGTPTVSPTVAPTGQAHTRAQGDPVAGTPSARQLGDLTVTIQWVPRPASLDHERLQGDPTARGLATVTITGGARGRELGTPQLSARTLPAGITHDRAQGAASVNPRTASPASLTHARGQDAPAVTVLWIARPVALEHARTVGTPTTVGHMLAGPPSLNRTRTQGTPVLSGRALPASLTHDRDIGDPDVNPVEIAVLALSRA